jgi:hypothetical protein
MGSAPAILFTISQATEGAPMATIKWAHYCDYAFLDITRRLCMVGVNNELNLPEALPVVLQATTLVALLDGPHAQQIKLDFRIVSPGGDVVQPGKFVLTHEFGYLFVHVHSLQIQAEGVLRFQLDFDGVQVLDLPVPVLLRQSEGSTPP